MIHGLNQFLKLTLGAISIASGPAVAQEFRHEHIGAWTLTVTSSVCAVVSQGTQVRNPSDAPRSEDRVAIRIFVTPGTEEVPQTQIMSEGFEESGLRFAVTTGQDFFVFQTWGNTGYLEDQDQQATFLDAFLAADEEEFAITIEEGDTAFTYSLFLDGLDEAFAAFSESCL